MSADDIDAQARFIADQYNKLLPRGANWNVTEVKKLMGLKAGALIVTYACSLAHSIGEARDNRALIGNRELTAITAHVFDTYPANEAVVIAPDHVTYDISGLPELHEPFRAYAGPPNFIPDTQENPAPYFILTGGVRTPEMVAAQKAEESKPWWQDMLPRMTDMLHSMDADAKKPFTPTEATDLNRWINNLEKAKGVIGESKPEPDPPVQVAEAKPVDGKPVADPSPPLLDVPVAPPDSGVAVAAVASGATAARALRAERVSDSAVAGDGAADDLFGAYYAACRQAAGSLLDMVDRILADRPPIPPYPGPGAAQGTGWGFEHSTFLDMDGKDASPGMESGLGAILQALAGAVPELKAFHKPAGGSDRDGAAWATVLVGGRWRNPMEPVSPGDIVRIANPMVARGYYWAIALEATKSVATKALAVYPGGLKFHAVEGSLGQTIAAWSPVTQHVLTPDSQLGKFWGPDMARMRALVNDHLYVLRGSDSPDTVIQDITKKTPYQADGIEGLLRVAGRELYAIDAHTPLYTGVLLFTGRDDEAGVLLADGSVLAMTHKAWDGAPSKQHWRRLAPRYVWYPRAAAG